MGYFDDIWPNVFNGDDTQGRDLFGRRLKERENRASILFMYLYHTRKARCLWGNQVIAQHNDEWLIAHQFFGT